jgi:fatty acid desaturase
LDYPQREDSKSVYDYSDKSIPQAGYVAVVYGLISVATTALSAMRAPAVPWIAFAVMAAVLALIYGVLVFGIFSKSRVAVVVMLVVVVAAQLYVWFFQHSPSGSILSIAVTGFLLRGARRIFQDHAERAAESASA